MEDAVVSARTDPAARRPKHLGTPSPIKSVPASPTKRIVAHTPLPTFNVLPRPSAVPPFLVSNDAEFLRALKRKRDDSPPPPVPKVEEDELAGDV